MKNTPNYHFQKNIIEDLESRLKNSKKVLFNCHIGSGKTNMSLEFILRNSLNKKTLILTGGQTELRTNFIDRAYQVSKFKDKIYELDGKSSSSKLTAKNGLFIGLPQTVKNFTKEELNPFNLLIVDEAHRRVTAKEFKSILNKLSIKTKIIYLSATPFNLMKDFPENQTINLYLEEGLKNGIVSNVKTHILESKEVITFEDYNSQDNLLSDFKIDPEIVKDNVHLILKEIVNRFLKNPISDISKLSNNIIPNIFNKEVGKSLFRCKSINEANIVFNVLKDIIGSHQILLSHSHMRNGIENIKQFKEDPEIKVIVVVNRATLGFDCPELQNVVDLSGSYNIPGIYQLFGRVARVHPKVHNKHFYKVASKGHTFYNEAVMRLVLGLSTEYIFQEFGRGNYKNTIKIPIKGKSLNKTKGGDKTNIKRPGKEALLLSEICNDFNRVWNNNGNIINEYSYLTLNEAALLGGFKKIISNPVKNKKEIIEFIKANKKKPSTVSKDINEKKLGQVLSNYTSQSSNSFDVEFKAEVDALCPIIDTVSIKKQQIIEFIETNKRRPSKGSKDAIEKKLGEALSTYLYQSSMSFDIEFKAKVDALCPIIDTVSIKKQQIIEFIETNKRRPSKGSKDAIEKKLGEALSTYLYQSSMSFDIEFKAKVDALCPIIDTVSIKKQQIIEFIETNKRRPSQVSKNINEKKLGITLSHYTSQSSNSFDVEFKAKVDALCPIIDTVSIKKQQIIEFIETNKRRPSQVSKNINEKKLGITLSHYTSQSSNSFDVEFKARITQLLEDLKI